MESKGIFWSPEILPVIQCQNSKNQKTGRTIYMTRTYCAVSVVEPQVAAKAYPFFLAGANHLWNEVDNCRSNFHVSFWHLIRS